jgi:hypothetical protein
MGQVLGDGFQEGEAASPSHRSAVDASQISSVLGGVTEPPVGFFPRLGGGETLGKEFLFRLPEVKGKFGLQIPVRVWAESAQAKEPSESREAWTGPASGAPRTLEMASAYRVQAREPLRSCFTPVEVSP